MYWSVCVHVCAQVRPCACLCVCVPVRGGGFPARHPQPSWLGLSLQGVILCFGLCARGQVKTVLNVLHDFEERIQESEQSWQIGAWRVSVRALGAS